MISDLQNKAFFERFLSNVRAGDRIIQRAPHEELIERAAEMIKSADCVLIGAGSGMSVAAGAQYGGQAFKTHFAEFRKMYGEDDPYMQDTYSAGFYPFPDERSFWGMWSRLALYGGADLDVTPLHKKVLALLSGKKYFLLTTNVDGQFERAGMPKEKIFATQGSYDRIQCRIGCHQKTYHAVDLFREMDKARKDGRIPTVLVPKCPVCGGPMAMNLRADSYFVQDEEWYDAESKFSDFLTECEDKDTVLLELGVGLNTPTIIRFPFEKLCAERTNICMIRMNLDHADIPKDLGERAVSIECDISMSINDLANAMI